MRLTLETERSIHSIQRRKIQSCQFFPWGIIPGEKSPLSLKEMSPSSSNAKLADNAAKWSRFRVYAKWNRSGTTRYEQL